MKFAKFDKNNLSSLRTELNAILNKYGVDANLEITVGNMKFSSTDVEIKVVAKIKGAKSFNENLLESIVKSLSIKMKNSSGDELVDYNTRAYKMPFVYRCGKTGKMFKCDENAAKRRFAA